MKQEAVDMLVTIKEELLDPFNGLIGIADTFVHKYGRVFNIIKTVKDAYAILKEGYVLHQNQSSFFYLFKSPFSYLLKLDYDIKRKNFI